VAKWEILSLSKTPKELQDRAEEQFRKKQEQAREGAKAMAEYEAERLAVIRKTARLRELRLAKEAADAEAGIKKKPTVAKKKSPR
jgi:hypothetical protein